MTGFLNRVNKIELFDRIKSNHRLSIKALHSMFGVTEYNELDRPRLISIRQQLVELELAGNIILEGAGKDLTAVYRAG